MQKQLQTFIARDNNELKYKNKIYTLNTKQKIHTAIILNVCNETNIKYN